jgi:hypothetical protein
MIGGHGGLGLAGLGVWIAFMATAEPALSWIAVGITFLAAGLGMATLLTAMPDPQRSGPLAADTVTADTATANTATADTTTANLLTATAITASTATASIVTQSTVTQSARAPATRPPVLVIALHGVFATITILVVLLAAIGAG